MTRSSKVWVSQESALPAFPKRRVRKWPSILVTGAMAFLVVIVLIGIFADVIAPYHYTAQNVSKRLIPPVFFGGDPAHLLGTDEIGRDVLSRIIYSVRISLLIALFGTVIGAVLGTFLGFVAAHSRGVIDQLIALLIDFQYAVPFIVFILAVVAVLGSTLPVLLTLIGIAGWQTYARLTRGMVFVAQSQPYFEAVRSAGAGPWRVYARHVLPNILSLIIVRMTLNFPATILLESGLSFLGLGVQPPLPSLGLMLNTGRTYMMGSPHLAVLPGALLFLTTLSMSILGDWVRDQLDPTLLK